MIIWKINYLIITTSYHTNGFFNIFLSSFSSLFYRSLFLISIPHCYYSLTLNSSAPTRVNIETNVFILPKVERVHCETARSFLDSFVDQSRADSFGQTLRTGHCVCDLFINCPAVPSCFALKSTGKSGAVRQNRHLLPVANSCQRNFYLRLLICSVIIAGNTVIIIITVIRRRRCIGFVNG